MGFHLCFTGAKLFPWIHYEVLKINSFKLFLACCIDAFSRLSYPGSVLPERLMLYFMYYTKYLLMFCL